MNDTAILLRDARAAVQRELEALDPVLREAETLGDPVAAALREFIRLYTDNADARLALDDARLRLRHRITIESRDRNGLLQSAVIEPI